MYLTPEPECLTPVVSLVCLFTSESVCLMWSRQCVWFFYQCVLNNVLLLLQISVSLYFNSLDKNPKLWEKTFQTSRRCPKAHISLTCLCLSIAGIKGVWYHCQERQPLPPTFSKLNRQMKQGCDEDHAHCLFSFFEDNFNPFQVWYRAPHPQYPQRICLKTLGGCLEP